MFIKIHQSYRQIVAICDSELLGKRFEEGDRILDVRETFYKGEQVDTNRAREIMIDLAKEDATFNIIGERAIKLALEIGLIVKSGIGRVNNIPFSLVLM